MPKENFYEHSYIFTCESNSIQLRQNDRRCDRISGAGRKLRSYGDDGDEVKTSVGTVFFVANQTVTKNLKGRNVEAVLFTIGSSPGWFWMPKSEFVKSTEPHDIKKQTGIPHQP
jgi:hypothetical protein